MDKNKTVPEQHKKSWIIGMMGAALGAGIGGYISTVKHNNIYSGVGAIIGYLVGITIGFLLRKNLNTKALMTTANLVYLILCLGSLIFVIASITIFVLTKDSKGGLGAIFFAICGLYFWGKIKSVKRTD